MGAIALSMLAALLWGVADFGAGLKSRQVPTLIVVAGMLMVGALAAGATVAVADPPAIEGRTLLLGLAAGSTTAIGLTSLYRGLAIGPMSVVAPISAAGVMIPVIAGLATGDQPSVAQGIGVALAIAGMLTVVAWSEDLEPAIREGRARATAIALAIVGAIGLGVYYLAAHGVRTDQETWFLLVGQLSAGLALAIGVFVRGLGIPARIDRWHIVALGALSFAAWASSTAAVGAGDLSLTATIVSLYPIVTVLLAVGLTDESLRGVQILALLAAFAGVGLIAGG
jgi:drug/metabolite transporter (DMT)-like permease